MKKLTLLSLLLIPILAFANPVYTKPDDVEIKKRLSDEQYYVTQEKGTEKAYRNAYWDNKEPGIYVDVVTGEPLFSSTDKYDSKTGWPSFTKPIDSQYIETKIDKGWFSTRIEVISKVGQSHLGHVFPDGPPPLYQRWCINSAALKFIPVSEMKEKGYESYMQPFSKDKPKNDPHEKQ